MFSNCFHIFHNVFRPASRCNEVNMFSSLEEGKFTFMKQMEQTQFSAQITFQKKNEKSAFSSKCTYCLILVLVSLVH